jgi:peptidoglycan glycosyltransferase
MNQPWSIDWSNVEGVALAVIALRVLFFLFTALFVWNLIRQLLQHRTKGDSFVVLLARGVAIVLIVLLGHQAYWQLAGFHNPKFVQFMGRYSRRVAGPQDSMQRGRILDWNGLVLAETVNGVRRYPHGRSTAHLTGYAHKTYGNSGVEKADDALLRGAAIRPTATDLKRFGQNLFDHRLVTGVDSVITVDARLQEAAAALMGEDRGAVVGIDPRTGMIRILYSAPSFDASDPEAALQGGNATLLNRALGGLYPPGSTFKSLVAAVATEHGMGGDINCPADGVAAEPGARKIRDHEFYESQRKDKHWSGHGDIDIRTALTRSSNVYFAKMAMLLGAQRMNEIASRFGLNQSLSVFDGVSGSMRGKACQLPRLVVGDRLSISQAGIGQGRVLVTPLHMAIATACIANGGVSCQPFLKAGTEPIRMPRAISKKAASLMTGYMEDVVKRGTGRGSGIHGLRVAGKTGTAQTPSGDDHGWFVAFAPVENPTLAIAVIVENSGYGSRRAVPIVRQLFLQADAIGLLRSAPMAGAP